MPERDDILVQAILTVSFVCEHSDSGVGYFNRTGALPNAVRLLTVPACSRPVFDAVGASLKTSACVPCPWACMRASTVACSVAAREL